MVKNAEVAPLYWYDFKVPDASTKEGRGELSDWIRLGYVSRNYTRSVTRTIEFSYDDFALSVVAKGIGNDTAHEKYLRRSANGRISGTNNTSSNLCKYSGHFRPRNPDGSWVYDDYVPLSYGNCYWGDD